MSLFKKKSILRQQDFILMLRPGLCIDWALAWLNMFQAYSLQVSSGSRLVRENMHRSGDCPCRPAHRSNHLPPWGRASAGNYLPQAGHRSLHTQSSLCLWRELAKKTTARQHLRKSPTNTTIFSYQEQWFSILWEEKPFHKSCPRPSENIFILWFITVAKSQLWSSNKIVSWLGSPEQRGCVKRLQH